MAVKTRGMGTMNTSLHIVMNQMAGALPAQASALSVHTEEDALRHADELLDDLFRQYRNASDHYKDIARRHGAQDPMAVLAADMAESLKSAYETRLIEVRSDAILYARAQSLLALKQEEAEIENKENSFAYRMRMIAFNNRNSLMRRLAQEKQDSMDMILLCYWLFTGAVRRAQYVFSLADDFRLAGAYHQREAQAS